MFAIVGIMGCIAAIGIIAAGAMFTASMIIGEKNKDDAQAAAARQEQMQAEANKKSENREKATEVLNKKITQKNLWQAAAQVGDSIAYAKLMTERAHRATAKEHHDFDSEKVNSAKSYSKGTPVAS
jgi:hypothetical protein